MSQKEGGGMLEALILGSAFFPPWTVSRQGERVPEDKELGKAFLTEEKPFLA